MGTAVIDFPIVVKKQGRIDPGTIQPDGIRPFTTRIFGPYYKILFIFPNACTVGNICCYDIEDSLMETDGRGIYACSIRCPFGKNQLVIPGNTMSDLVPVHQVSTVENRYRRKILKGTCHQIIVISCSANAGIRMESRYNWIFVFHIISPFHIVLFSLINANS